MNRNGVAGKLSNSLNTTANVQSGTLDVYGSESFIFNMSEEATKSIIEALQDFFNGYSLGKAFNDSLKQSNKEVITTSRSISFS